MIIVRAGNTTSKAYKGLVDRLVVLLKEMYVGLVATEKAQTQPMGIKCTHVHAYTHNSGLLSLCLNGVFFPTPQ